MMLVKRFLAVVVVFLVWGLTASSAMAASDTVPKSTQGTPQTVGCPCCSGNVSLPKDLKVQELKGPVAYFKALEAFNVKDSLALRRNLYGFHFTPDFNNATILLVSSSKGTTEIIKVPAYGKYRATVIHVRNELGDATGIAIYKNKTVEIYYYKNGKLEKVVKSIPAPEWGLPGKCTICKYFFAFACGFGVHRIVQIGCRGVCGIFCAAFIEEPWIVVICVAACIPPCDDFVQYALEFGGGTICGTWGASKFCKMIHACG
ncbi:hypothetical protein [Thermococcus sp.]|uniref:hypothetical protein n=1 Tax=Thermococcus sp. TaxID=35749 RepID=UPI0026323BC8|nr:hypothetical protein [Thermococcus sp.]